jgi:hypothetical protein
VPGRYKCGRFTTALILCPEGGIPSIPKTPDKMPLKSPRSGVETYLIPVSDEAIQESVY